MKRKRGPSEDFSPVGHRDSFIQFRILPLPESRRIVNAAQRRICKYLSQPDTPGWVLNFYAIAAAFTAYFCMYAFRKPFAAATYAGDGLLGSEITPKTAFVVSQLIGYTISKFLGVRVCTSLNASQRTLALALAVLWAEASLLLFAVGSVPVQIVAIFLNGLPLGMVWGLVMAYLEGRRGSEIQFAGMSISFVIASGVVKDAGRGLLSAGISEAWMPFLTGLIFIVPFGVALFLLRAMPPPPQKTISLNVLNESR